VNIRYRKTTEGSWRTGHDLWYDTRTNVGFQPRPVEARGSIVHCDPDTDYIVQFGMPKGDGTTDWIAQLSAHTWSENFPVGSTLKPFSGTQTSTTTSSFLGSHSGSSRSHVLLMNQSGTANGYTLYDLTGATAKAANQSNSYGVVVQGSYMILRGLTVVGGESGIFIDPGSHHIVIEGCDMAAAVPGLAGPADLPNLAAELARRGFAPADVAAVLGGNLRRLLNESIGTGMAASP